MFKRAYEYIGSKSFSMTLLKFMAGYCVYLAVLGAFGAVPPGFWMLWGPLVVWGVCFLINVIISIVTQKYVHTGNIVFHAAFPVVAAGILISVFWRFEGTSLMIDGDAFFGEKREYISHNAGDRFEKLAPALSFKMGEIRPEFWEDKLYFTDLSAAVKYPAETLNNEGRVYLNGGMTINGAKLRLSEYGFLPHIIIQKGDEYLNSGPLYLRLFPPGAEETLDIGQYIVKVSVFSDAKEKGGKIINQSMYVREPVFLVEIKWLGREIFKGLVKAKEPVMFGNYTVIFSGLEHYVMVSVVYDLGEKVVLIGMLMAAIGMLMRLWDELRSKPHGN